MISKFEISSINGAPSLLKSSSFAETEKGEGMASASAIAEYRSATAESRSAARRTGEERGEERDA